MTSQDGDEVKPTFWSIVGSRTNEIFGAIVLSVMFGAALYYELGHGMYLQAVAALLFLGFVAYGLVTVFAAGAKRRQTLPRREVGDWVTTRSWPTIVLIGIVIVTTILGWAAPNHWNVERGTVGWSEVWRQHEWWRLVTSPFLHANITHLWFNMGALYVLGTEIDRRLGSVRLLAVYAAAALGGGLMVVAMHQEKTLGASGAIYGLLGALLVFGVHAFREGHRTTAKRAFFATGAVIAINLLFGFALPFISLACHVGGLLAGAITALAVGFPKGLGVAWALTDRCPKGAAFSYDVNVGRFSYHGPAGFALERDLVDPNDFTTTKAAGWSPMMSVRELDPATPIDAYVTEESALRILDAPSAGVQTSTYTSSPSTATS